MNEVGTSLTTTGLIATIVSVLFAIAALYVSHRRRTHTGGHTVLHTSQSTNTITPQNPGKSSHVHMPLSSDPHVAHPASSAPSGQSALVVGNPLPASGTSTFNRLSAHGVHKANLANKDDPLYEWE